MDPTLIGEKVVRGNMDGQRIIAKKVLYVYRRSNTSIQRAST
jgi:hypothetical protein